ncbi:carboxypeptidase-like regulatory domain-containing protein [Pendulispora albinea]|uniref:Carboxypeptidase-like regulatory domain-containing protein n=1 Tax=Pendulispora albinea TaxID=2741071 RepID=A0ABZ2LJT7_9BACT
MKVLGGDRGRVALAAFAWLLALLGAAPACRDRRDPESGAVPPAAGPVNALAVPSETILAAVNPQGLGAYQGPVGVIEGTIAVRGDLPPVATEGDYRACPQAKELDAPLFREGAPLAHRPGARALADAVVAVTGYDGFYVPERAESKRIVFEKGCAFSSRAVTLTFGQRLEIANASHIVLAPAFDQAPNPALMVAAPAGRGDPVHLYPPRPGYFTLRDRMGSDFVKLDVYVLLQPLHTVSAADGSYRIEGVPAGVRTIHARLAAIGETETTVDVRPGIVHTVDLTLAYHREPHTPRR